MTGPENVTMVAERIQQVGDLLVQEGVTKDELVRAVQPLLSGIAESKRTNDYWLTNSQAHPYFLDWTRSAEELYTSVTVEDVSQVASMYLRSDKFIVATMIPVD
jgi:zinc protease